MPFISNLIFVCGLGYISAENLDNSILLCNYAK